MGFRTGWRRALPHPDGLPVRVATFNVEGGGVLAQLLPMVLDRWGAQIVAFQECGESLAAAAAQLPGWHHFEGKDLCLLSKYPIRRAEVMDRSGLDRVKQSESKEIGGAGYVIRFVLDGPRGPIRVANLHLETPRKGFEGLMDRDLRRIRMNTGPGRSSCSATSIPRSRAGSSGTIGATSPTPSPRRGSAWG